MQNVVARTGKEEGQKEGEEGSRLSSVAKKQERVMESRTRVAGVVVVQSPI